MKTGKGLFAASKKMPYKKELNSDDFNKWLKEIFTRPRHSEHSGKRWIIVGIDFIKGYRKEFGDDELYSVIKAFNIQCGEDTLNYIEKFVKEYEKTNQT